MHFALLFIPFLHAFLLLYVALEETIFYSNWNDAELLEAFSDVLGLVSGKFSVNFTGPKIRFPILSVVEDMYRAAVSDISCSYPAHFSCGKCGLSLPTMHLVIDDISCTC